MTTLARYRNSGSKSTYSIDIRIWVLGLAVLCQNTRSNLINLADKLEHGVVGKMA